MSVKVTFTVGIFDDKSAFGFHSLGFYQAYFSESFGWLMLALNLI